jgi:hypothetical protein
LSYFDFFEKSEKILKFSSSTHFLTRMFKISKYRVILVM